MAMDETPLSSEQALDDYFNSLLGIGDFSEDIDGLPPSTVLSDAESKEDDVVDIAVDVEVDIDTAVDVLSQQDAQCTATENVDAGSQVDGELHSPSKVAASEDANSAACLPEPREWLSPAQSSMTQPAIYPSTSAPIDYDEPPNLQQLEKLFDGMRGDTDAVTLSQSETDSNESLETEIQGWEIATEEAVANESNPQADGLTADTSKSVDVNLNLDRHDSVDVQPAIAETAPEVGTDTSRENESADAHIGAASTGDVGGGHLDSWQSTERSESFQVLYFSVNDVTFAVPLDELGGIHQMGELSHLIGRPGWYLGLQSSRDSQFDVVDTARWVMPQVLNGDDYKLDYEYIVMLGESNWGLAATKLKGTEQLQPEAVRWREQSGKRPWLAGMVKEKMCALVHVSELIEMLNAGLDVNSVQ
ncbi:chemotaxis protein CheW [Vibrio sp. E150_011]